MPIKSLMFGWEYPPLHLGGLGIACQGIVRGLMKNNVNVTLVLPHPNTGEEGVNVISPEEGHIKAIRVQSMISPYENCDGYIERVQKLSKEMQQMYGSDLPQAVAHFTNLSVEMTKDIPTDVVHCHDWMTYGAGTQAAGYHGKPLVAHIHATEMDRTNFHPNQWIYNMERRGFERADKVIAVSNYTKNLLIKHYGIPPEKIHVVHNGTYKERLQTDHIVHAEYKKPHKPMILFLGRLTIQKGPIQFLETAAKVHAINPDVMFVMAGEGNMMGEIIDRACALGLQDCMIFTGKVTSKEAGYLYTKADCFVMPSLSEPFGLVALEAIEHGTPVILSKQSGASEVVGHAFVVDFWDTEKMADCVLTILRDEPLALQLKSEAPRALQHLTWANQGRQVRAIYEDLLSAKV